MLRGCPRDEPSQRVWVYVCSRLSRALRLEVVVVTGCFPSGTVWCSDTVPQRSCVATPHSSAQETLTQALRVLTTQRVCAASNNACVEACTGQTLTQTCHFGHLPWKCMQGQVCLSATYNGVMIWSGEYACQRQPPHVTTEFCCRRITGTTKTYGNGARAATV